jgi:hypothetical protein
MNINEVNFPEAKEQDEVLWSDGKWYVYINNTWILKENQ